MVFDNHYDTTAICMASRANVMTGMFEYKTVCNFEHGPMMQATWEKTYLPTADSTVIRVTSFSALNVGVNLPPLGEV